MLHFMFNLKDYVLYYIYKLFLNKPDVGEYENSKLFSYIIDNFKVFPLQSINFINQTKMVFGYTTKNNTVYMIFKEDTNPKLCFYNINTNNFVINVDKSNILWFFPSTQDGSTVIINKVDLSNKLLNGYIDMYNVNQDQEITSKTWNFQTGKCIDCTYQGHDLFLQPFKV